MRIYLVYDLTAVQDSDPLSTLIAATLKESSAREAVYRYLQDDAGLNEKDWEDLVEQTGCRDFEELASEIRYSHRHDKELGIRVEEIDTED